MIPQAAKKPAAWLALCVACVGSAEGLRTVAYRDPVGIPTICFGDTKGVKLGDTASPAQCQALLADRVQTEFGPAVDRCVRHPLPPERKAAYTSLAYNVGTSAFCGSSVVRYENAGNVRGACDAILKYNKMRVGGILVTSPGLANRRGEERKLCLMGLV